MLDILQKIFTVFQTDAQSYRSVKHRHLGTLFGGEKTEDGGGGMNGQRLTIEEIRGTTDNLQLIDEREGIILLSEVDGEHSSW